MAGLCEGGNEPPGSLKASKPHIDVSLTCEHDPKLQEHCVCPQNMPQFDSEGIPNQAPETNKPMILNGPTSRNLEGSDQYRRAVRLKCAGAPSAEVNVLTIDQWSVF
ncbi:hypothetical protein ANN_20213 [Periplaneta americana]|uniref:Uncharacterized protein n=1 Tax=Periplaneta americana TaxID=6978 RepID=A0ABQ8SCN7_PERAM|nr:hypothetical protein ANN_20213 [Periplaneta americana]